MFSDAACACCAASLCPPSFGSSMSYFCARGSCGLTSSSNGRSLRTCTSGSSGLLPSTGVCAALSLGSGLYAEAEADDAAPAPLAVAAAGPPVLIPSFGFHVWSLGYWVPGEVCLACPVAGCCEEGEAVGDLRAALGADFGGGGRGGLLELEALRICSAVEGIIGDAWRRCAEGREEGRIALSAVRGSIFGFKSVTASDYRSIAAQPQSIVKRAADASSNSLMFLIVLFNSEALLLGLGDSLPRRKFRRYTFPFRRRPTQRTR